MPFVFRTHSRFPVCCPMTYEVGHSEGKGTVWDLSVSAFRFSTDSPLAAGQVCSLIVELPNKEKVRVAAAVVRWTLDEADDDHQSSNFEYGTEILVADTRAKRQFVDYLLLRVTGKGVERRT